MFVECPWCHRAHLASENMLDVIDSGGSAAQGEVWEFINYKCSKCGRKFYATITFSTEIKSSSTTID